MCMYILTYTHLRFIDIFIFLSAFLKYRPERFIYSLLRFLAQRKKSFADKILIALQLSSSFSMSSRMRHLVANQQLLYSEESTLPLSHGCVSIQFYTLYNDAYLYNVLQRARRKITDMWCLVEAKRKLWSKEKNYLLLNRLSMRHDHTILNTKKIMTHLFIVFIN